MKQEVRYIRDSSEKMIEAKLKMLLDEGHVIQQIVQLSRTSFLILLQPTQGE